MSPLPAPSADATAVPPPPAPATFWKTDLIVVAVGFLLWVAWDLTGLDLTVIRWYGTAQGFPWREHWLARDIVHSGGRGLGFLVLGLLVVNLRWPLLRRWAPAMDLRERGYWLLLTLACLLVVPALKQISLTSCPWSLQEFGGPAAYVSHWRWGVPDGGSGGCFPSGHAVSAFGFVGGFMMLRRHHRGAAFTWLGVVLALGAVYGWTQMARGAHYISHSLWSAWWCWTFCVLAAPGSPLARGVGAILRRRAPAAPPAAVPCKPSSTSSSKSTA